MDPLSVHMSTRYPSTDDWDGMLSVYLLSLFWHNKRGHRVYTQRSVLVTTKSTSQIESELNVLVEVLHEEDPQKKYQYELIEQEFMYLKNKTPVAYDSAIIAIGQPLRLGRRSSRTGKVYQDPTKLYCPYTGTSMHYLIISGRLISEENHS